MALTEKASDQGSDVNRLPVSNVYGAMPPGAPSTIRSLAALGAVAAALGALFALTARPSSAAAPSALASASASAYAGYCSTPVTSWHNYPQAPAPTTYRGRVTQITASYDTADVTVQLDGGGTIDVQLNRSMIDLALQAYRQKTSVEIGARSVPSCQVVRAEWIRL